MIGGKILEQIEIYLRDKSDLTIYIDIFDSNLSRKWLSSLNDLLRANYHLEKNYCFFGFVDQDRNGPFLVRQINSAFEHINGSNLDYKIDDFFVLEDLINDDLSLNHTRFNWLHRYFEDLQGTSGAMSPYYLAADAETRWHIRQLNLLCHELEAWALSFRKSKTAPEWQRPSQLMCWLNAPRFLLEPQDFEHFGIETINRDLGGVYLGVNKAVGKHHWEVFNDEGRDSRIGELISTSMRSQTEASGDFDIEWANNPGNFYWQKSRLKEFREWLEINGFDPNDKSLTIGHPKIGQVDLARSFGTEDYTSIWQQLSHNLNVTGIRTSSYQSTYSYHWSDTDFIQKQIEIIKKGEYRAVDKTDH